MRKLSVSFPFIISKIPGNSVTAFFSLEDNVCAGLDDSFIMNPGLVFDGPRIFN
jgi:hypothetical protein